MSAITIPADLNVYYGTFGNGQVWPNECVKILAPDHGAAREVMHTAFGERWCTTYEQEFEDSEFFTLPIMTLFGFKECEYDDHLTIRCLQMNSYRLQHRYNGSQVGEEAVGQLVKAAYKLDLWNDIGHDDAASKELLAEAVDAAVKAIGLIAEQKTSFPVSISVFEHIIYSK